jgi:hypothetical protein
MPQLKKRSNKYFGTNGANNSEYSGFTQQDSPTELLKTIKYSNNFFNMKLPKATYEKLTYATLPTANLNKGASSNSRQQSKLASTNATTQKTQN